MDQDESDDAHESDDDEVIEDEDEEEEDEEEESNIDNDRGDEEEEEEEEELTVESLGKVNGIDSTDVFTTRRTLQSSPGRVLQPRIGLCST